MYLFDIVIIKERNFLVDMQTISWMSTSSDVPVLMNLNNQLNKVCLMEQVKQCETPRSITLKFIVGILV